MSTIKVENIRIASEAVSRPVTGVAAAWVNYNQFTPAISNSLNISSVSDEATGEYITAFTSNMANATYCEAGMARAYHINSSSSDDISSSGDKHETFYVDNLVGGREAVDMPRSYVTYYGELA